SVRLPGSSVASKRALWPINHNEMSPFATQQLFRMSAVNADYKGRPLSKVIDAN
ncbi:hypothetical protein BaRGS_00026564, partial [Batillaria attramentaria]